MKNNEFISMVNNDIERCENALNTEQNILPLLNELFGKYSKVSSNFPQIQMNPVLLTRPNVVWGNLQAILGFLKAYSLNNCEDYRFDESNQNGINVITNIANTNQNSINISSFTEVKKKIENMSSLPDDEIEQILQKLNELEKVINSDERKSKKWSKAKEIAQWVLDKGADIALAILPLLSNIR